MKKNTREKILEAAFVLMLQNGYNGVSTRDITAHIGITPSLPYRYFSTKRDLLLESLKLFFCDKFFNDADNPPENSTLKEVIDLICHRQGAILKQLEKSLNRPIDPLRYNMLYLESLDSDERFRAYAFIQMKKLLTVCRNAAKTGEIENVDPSFAARVLLDIWGRSVNYFGPKGSSSKLKNIISDIRNFYESIKKR